MTRSLLNWKKTQITKNDKLFRVLVIWPSSTWKLLVSYLFLISNNVWAIFSLRDHQQIIFVTFNRFCLLSNTPPPAPRSPVNGQSLVGWNLLEGTSYKRMKDTVSLPVPLFLVLHRIRIYIGRYHFYNFIEPNPTFTEKRFSS